MFCEVAESSVARSFCVSAMKLTSTRTIRSVSSAVAASSRQFYYDSMKITKDGRVSGKLRLTFERKVEAGKLSV